jgi:hypothetical protein
MCIGIRIELNIKETEAIEYERPTSKKTKSKTEKLSEYRKCAIRYAIKHNLNRAY